MRHMLSCLFLAVLGFGLAGGRADAEDAPYRVVFDLTSRDSLDQSVTFRVCAIALKNNKTDKSQLLEQVQTVPDGIYEIFTKQRQGWGYIKVMH